MLKYLVLIAMIPLLELWLLIEMTRLTSIGWTIVLVISTGMIGMSLVRHQGLQSLRQIQSQIAAGQSPSDAIISGLMVLVAGAFLITPGLITDTTGFLLLIPGVRSAIGRWIKSRLTHRVIKSFQGSVWVGSFSAGQGFASSSTPDGNRPEGGAGVQVIEPTSRLPESPAN